MSTRWRRLALGTWLALLALTVLWEAWLASSGYAPRAFWLTVKVVPLAALLPPLLRGRPKPYVYAMLVALLYLTEGAVLAWTESAAGFGPASIATLALAEALLAAAFVVSAGYYVRAAGGVR